MRFHSDSGYDCQKFETYAADKFVHIDSTSSVMPLIQWHLKLGVLYTDILGSWYKVLMIINNAPAEIVNKVYTHSLHGFAGYIKTKILQLYQETCTMADCYIWSRN